MTDTRTPPTEPGAALLRAGRFCRRGTVAVGDRPDHPDHPGHEAKDV